MANHNKGAAMKRNKMMFLAVLAVAALSGCATARSDLAAAEAAAPATTQVSKPAASYGSMGGYRYRRLVTVNVHRS
jgi:curli biogenesis system outer membrane secretion channel CsgG